MVAVGSMGQRYLDDGFISPVRLLDADMAAVYRNKLEAVEAVHGTKHYTSKMHTILDFVAEIATAPQVLDAVEAMLGPDILLFDCTFIIKEPGTRSHVSWHQDLTYWGLTDDRQVSMWLALSTADELSGCMRMIPGSHRHGRFEHHDEKDTDNVLHRGQTVKGVDETASVLCPLKPGEASFHHGWTLHASMPNRSHDRRIGLNVQYLHPGNRHTLDPHASGIMVRGKDAYGYYEADAFARGSMLAEDLARHAEAERRMKETWSIA